jgi:hypothetical protein
MFISATDHLRSCLELNFKDDLLLASSRSVSTNL